ncbi:TraM recognition domain-containing protein, partial [bacterium]|nr:TraM recognition domain-containing protein [bacterium]
TILDQRYHLTGDTGSMKTSLVAGPLAAQLMARNDCTVVVLDLKGDRSLFETCRVEAQRAGLPFSWFTTERGRSSWVFNPFEQSYHAAVTPEQESETLLQGMSLDYGVDYGRAYFTSQNEMSLKALMRKLNLKSAAALFALLNDPGGGSILSVRELKDAGHLRAIASRLMTIAPLNAELPAGASRRIEAADVLRRKQVVYFNLSSPQEPLSAATVARMFLWSLFSCAAHDRVKGNRVYVFVDEFQQIIAENIKPLFSMIRGLGVTLVPVHQTLGQLDQRGADLIDTVDSNTAVKHILRASEPRTMRRIAEMSGVQTYHTFSWTQDTTEGDGTIDPTLAVDGLVQVSETHGKALDDNTILAVSSDQASSFIRFTFGSGYTQFAGRTTIVRSLYPIDRERYDRRDNAPWPILPDDPTPPALPVAPPDPKSLPPAPPDGKGTDWDERFRNDSL